MTTKTPRVFSDLPIPPGEVLAEELEVRGMTQRELAARLNRPPQVINEIIRGKKAITPDTAIALGKVLGGDPQFWTNLESDYQMTLARERNRKALADEEQWLSEYPIREMIKRGWIEAGRDKASKLKALLSFLEVASVQPKVYQEAVGFRITEAAQQKVSPGALAVWLRKGEIEAEKIDTADYNEAKFRAALATIRGMTELPPEEFLPAMTTLCAEAGVAFCMVRELPKSGANGVARWLTNSKALIQMSIRNKRADIFWFSFFHEADHLLEHRTQRRLVIDGLGTDPDTAAMEKEADRFARDFLIAPEDWADFCDEGYFAPASIRKFAQSVRIAPGIVVGRLQHEKWIGWNQINSLRQSYEWVANPHTQ